MEQKITIAISGIDEISCKDAFNQAVKQIKLGFNCGFDSNEDSRFNFDVKTTDAQECKLKPFMMEIQRGDHKWTKEIYEVHAQSIEDAREITKKLQPGFNILSVFEQVE